MKLSLHRAPTPHTDAPVPLPSLDSDIDSYDDDSLSSIAKALRILDKESPQPPKKESQLEPDEMCLGHSCIPELEVRTAKPSAVVSMGEDATSLHTLPSPPRSLAFMRLWAAGVETEASSCSEPDSASRIISA